MSRTGFMVGERVRYLMEFSIYLRVLMKGKRYELRYEQI